jgi:hypothetical protein
MKYSIGTILVPFKSKYFNRYMRHFKSFIIVACLLIFFFSPRAQINPEGIFKSNIKTVRLHMYGDQQALPIYRMNNADRLELHFDDLDGNVKSYYYTYQLCDYDWHPVQLSPFDYIRGFTQQRISNYRLSSIAYTRYTHYQAILPDANSAAYP